MQFRHGEPVAPLKIVADAPGKKGTEVTFLPSSQTFTKTEFDFATLEHRLRELAFLNSGVTIILADKRGVEKKEVTLHYEGGLAEFVRQGAQQIRYPRCIVGIEVSCGFIS